MEGGGDDSFLLARGSDESLPFFSPPSEFRLLVWILFAGFDSFRILFFPVSPLQLPGPPPLPLHPPTGSEPNSTAHTYKFTRSNHRVHICRSEPQTEVRLPLILTSPEHLETKSLFDTSSSSIIDDFTDGSFSTKCFPFWGKSQDKTKLCPDKHGDKCGVTAVSRVKN